MMCPLIVKMRWQLARPGIEDLVQVGAVRHENVEKMNRCLFKLLKQRLPDFRLLCGEAVRGSHVLSRADAIGRECEGCAGKDNHGQATLQFIANTPEQC